MYLRHQSKHTRPVSGVTAGLVLVTADIMIVTNVAPGAFGTRETRAATVRNPPALRQDR